MTFMEISNLTKHYNDAGKPAVDQFEIRVEKGEIITLLGPSGCGKTTTLRMIAGFERPTSGQIVIDGQIVHHDNHSYPPEKRGIGMVFQDYALFPHLTIEKNIMFGLGKWKTQQKKERTQEVLELIDMYDYAQRYPHQLSGGQQQRVALARALAPYPHVVLMDEPFSNLDAGLREKMRFDIADILRKTNTTAIIVTHDQKDAFAVSDRVVVMNAGVVQQVAAPMEMYRCPTNCFVAKFLGKTNILTGKLASDMKHVYTHIGKVCLPEKTSDTLESVTVSIRPEGCKLSDHGRYQGKVEKVIYGGQYQELHIRLQVEMEEEQMMTLNAPIDQQILVGHVVSFDINPELVSVVDHPCGEHSHRILTSPEQEMQLSH